MSGGKPTGGEKLIATNPHARSKYSITETFEAGIMLTGTEIKSLRAQAPSLRDAFVEIDSKQEAWLVGAHIAPYAQGNIWNHEPMRRRKLLLHHREIEKIFGALTRGGMSAVPTRFYLKGGRAKVELGLGKPKRKGDHREDHKRRQAEREMGSALKRSRSDDHK